MPSVLFAKTLESNEEAFVKQKLGSKDWNERRFAAIGTIGSAQPSIIKDLIPLLIAYASDPEKVRNGFDDLNRKDAFIHVTISTSMDKKWPTWLRNACVDALGMIEKRSPECMKAAIPLLEKL